MAENNFVQKTLDALLKIVEVEFKIPLGFAEIKLPVTDHVKEWWKNKKSKTEIEEAIKRAEEKFIADHSDKKVAQILREMPLHSEEDYQKVITNLLVNLNEEQINWLAETKIQKIWGSIVNIEEIQEALELYIPYLRNELRTIKEFREVITSLTIERIDKRTERIESKLDEALKLDNKDRKPEKLNTGWFFGHQYGDIEFTGRDEERKMLKDWLDEKKDNLFVLRALGGFGKTSLAWEWLNNDIDKQKWHTAIWWSFYEKNSGFENFLTETLNHLGIETKDISSRQQINDLLEIMKKTNILIVMDGFERLLRQYASMDAIYKDGIEDEEEIKNIDPSQRDCISLIIENFLRGLSNENLQSKVLITTRLTPRVLEGKNAKLLKGFREESLDVFKEDDVIKYFQSEDIKATRAEILEVSKRYGFHPLSLSLLVGIINEDHDNKGDINVVKQLDIFDDIKQNRHHVLERAFESLTNESRELLNKISCFRGAIEYSKIKELFNIPDFEKSLIDLKKRCLLKYIPQLKIYDMHPIVRNYSYRNFPEENRNTTHKILCNYYKSIVKPSLTPDLIPKNLDEAASVIELFYHAIQIGEADEAWIVYRQYLSRLLRYQLCQYELVAELLNMFFYDNSYKVSKLKNNDFASWTLNELFVVVCISGQTQMVTPIYQQKYYMDIQENDRQGIAAGVSNMASLFQIPLGLFKESDKNLRYAISLDKKDKRLYEEADDRLELGRLLLKRGAWLDAEQELSKAFELAKKISNLQVQTIIWAYRAMRFLHILRDKNQFQKKYLKLAIEYSERSIKLADETTKTTYSHPTDYARAYWLLGASLRVNNNLDEAEENLSKAFHIYRQINWVEIEADILLELAKLRYAQNNYEEAKSLADEALTITERCGYVLQGADVNLFLSQYALEQENDKVKAKEYAETALKLAYCDGPPYYYKVAYHEAEAMLEKLK